MNKHKKNRQAFATENAEAADYVAEPRAFERTEHAAANPPVAPGPPVAEPRAVNPFAGRKA